jgi:hypothetical protein
LLAAASVDCHLREYFRLRLYDGEDVRRRQRVDEVTGDLAVSRQQRAAAHGADKDIFLRERAGELDAGEVTRGMEIKMINWAKASMSWRQKACQYDL